MAVRPPGKDELAATARGYGMHLIAYYGRPRLEVPDAWPETVKLVVLGGRYSVENYQARHYAMARNLVFEVRRRYDEALSSFDVLIMPTLPMVATPIPAASDPCEVPNTAFERLSGGFPAPPAAA